MPQFSLDFVDERPGADARHGSTVECVDCKHLRAQCHVGLVHSTLGRTWSEMRSESEISAVELERKRDAAKVRFVDEIGPGLGYPQVGSRLDRAGDCLNDCFDSGRVHVQACLARLEGEDLGDSGWTAKSHRGPCLVSVFGSEWALET